MHGSIRLRLFGQGRGLLHDGTLRWPEDLPGFEVSEQVKDKLDELREMGFWLEIEPLASGQLVYRATVSDEFNDYIDRMLPDLPAAWIALHAWLSGVDVNALMAQRRKGEC